jgi:hypothetical protein
VHGEGGCDALHHAPRADGRSDSWLAMARRRRPTGICPFRNTTSDGPQCGPRHQVIFKGTMSALPPRLGGDLVRVGRRVSPSPEAML